MGHSLVIIPTYKESSNISKILEAAIGSNPDFHVLVVDDGSPDGTAHLVKQKMVKYPGRLHLIERSGKLGLGTAYITGFKWGLGKGYDYIFEMDADFSHNPSDLNRLHEVVANGTADIAVGSRYVRGGKVVNWPFMRLFLSFGASLYVRIITWMPVKDPTAGFICYHRRVLESLNLDNIKFTGYAFQIEMKYKARFKGFSIKEIPITFTDRIEGSSKMSKAIVREAITGVIKLKWLQITGRL